MRARFIDKSGSKAPQLLKIDGSWVLPLDTETHNTQGLTALDHKTSKISLAQIHTADSLDIYDALVIGHIPGWLADWIEDGDIIKIIHNAAFEYKMFLSSEGITIRNIWCTMIAEQQLRCGLNLPNDLGSVVKRYTDVELPKNIINDHSSWGKRPLDKKQLVYAFNDPRYLPDVYAGQLEKFKAFRKAGQETSDMEKLFQTEMEALPYFCETEMNGVYFDLGKAQEVDDLYAKRMDKELKTIQSLLPPVPLTKSDAAKKKMREKFPEGVKPVTSNNDFKRALTAVGVKLPTIKDKATKKVRESLSANTYHLITHPSGKWIKQYTETKKLKTSYLEPILRFKDDEKKAGWIHPVTLRAHPNIRQNGTNTARPAYKDPALQTIPKFVEDPEVMDIKTGKPLVTTPFRDMVEAEGENWYLVKADQSQIELRAIAVIARDQNMMAAFKKDIDIHTLTAALVNNIPLAMITEELRDKAKPVNFGLSFDQSAAGFQDYAKKEYGIDFTLEECKFFKKQFLESYPGIKAYHYQVKKDTRDAMFNDRAYMATGMLGRVRYWRPGGIPLVYSGRGDQDDPFNYYTVCKDVINFPVQNANAEIMKRAEIYVSREIHDKKLRAKSILQVHDEKVLEVHKDDLKETILVLHKGMKRAADEVLRIIPSKVEVAVGKRWGKDYMKKVMAS